MYVYNNYTIYFVCIHYGNFSCTICLFIDACATIWHYNIIIIITTLSLIPFTRAWNVSSMTCMWQLYSSDLESMVIISHETIYCWKIHDRPRCGAARPAQLHHQRAHAHVHILDWSCDSVNLLARETTQLPYSFTRKDSEEKTLRIKSPPSGKHPWTTSTPEFRCLPSPGRQRAAARNLLSD